MAIMAKKYGEGESLQCMIDKLLRNRIAELEDENDRLKEQLQWQGQYQFNFDQMTESLKLVRSFRPSGEPQHPDWLEVANLVHNFLSLKERNKELEGENAQLKADLHYYNTEG